VIDEEENNDNEKDDEEDDEEEEEENEDEEEKNDEEDNEDNEEKEENEIEDTTGVADENDEIAGVTKRNIRWADEVEDTTGVAGEISGMAKANHRHNLRPRAPRDYTKAVAPKDYAHAHAAVENIVMTQHSVKKGLKLYGEAGAEAVVSKMQQLHDRDVTIEPKSANMLTVEEKRKALHYLMFLKKKRCGRIKGRGCADGRKQRIYKTKEETSAPAVTIESLFLSSVIDVKEGRAVVTLDIPGAFMQADMDEVLYMKLEGPLAHLLTKVDPKRYSKFVATERGKQVIYVKLKRRCMARSKQHYCFGKTYRDA
jgi:hypothetical protein